MLSHAHTLGNFIFCFNFDFRLELKLDPKVLFLVRLTSKGFKREFKTKELVIGTCNNKSVVDAHSFCRATCLYILLRLPRSYCICCSKRNACAWCLSICPFVGQPRSTSTASLVAVHWFSMFSASVLSKPCELDTLLPDISKAEMRIIYNSFGDYAN